MSRNAKQLPELLAKARLAWMVVKGMKVEDAARMLGRKIVDLARDNDSEDVR